MLKIFIFYLFLVICFPTLGLATSNVPPSSEEEGYEYVGDNYFSDNQPSEQNNPLLKRFTIQAGPSLYRESTEKSLNSFSAFTLNFNHIIKEVSSLFDVNLQWTVFYSKLKEDRVTLLELTPRISIPEARSDFPLYVGVGLGLGIYPYYIIKKQAFLAANGQFFAGLRFSEIHKNIGVVTELNAKIHYPFKDSTMYLELIGQVGLMFNF